MGTKNTNFGGKIKAPGGSYARREREFAAQASLSGPTPAWRSVLACRSVPAHTPGERIPRLIKSSKCIYGPASYITLQAIS